MTFFEWDERKAEANRRKHGIRFEEAAKIFDDENAISEVDRFVEDEPRWQTIGTLPGARLLLVAHTVSEEGADEVIRIISARPANAAERRRYEQNDSQEHGRG